MPTGTYTVMHQRTTAITGTTGTALSKEAAIAATIAAATVSGPTGREVHVWQSEQLSASGPTGVYSTTFNQTDPLTGATFSALSKEAAIVAAVAAGPTGPGAGIDVWSAST